MTELHDPPRRRDAASAALGAVASAHLGVLVFTESYRMLPAVMVGYGAAWWVLRRAAG